MARPDWWYEQRTVEKRARTVHLTELGRAYLRQLERTDGPGNAGPSEPTAARTQTTGQSE